MSRNQQNQGNCEKCLESEILHYFWDENKKRIEYKGLHHFLFF
jgi:hypothetical protein